MRISLAFSELGHQFEVIMTISTGLYKSLYEPLFVDYKFISCSGSNRGRAGKSAKLPASLRAMGSVIFRRKQCFSTARRGYYCVQCDFMHTGEKDELEGPKDCVIDNGDFYICEHHLSDMACIGLVTDTAQHSAAAVEAVYRYGKHVEQKANRMFIHHVRRSM